MVLGMLGHANKGNIPGTAENKGQGDLDAWTSSWCKATLAALELPASLSWGTHTGFHPVRPLLLGFLLHILN